MWFYCYKPLPNIYFLLPCSGPNLGKMCLLCSDPAPSHEMLVKIYFVVKPLKKGLNRRFEKCPFL